MIRLDSLNLSRFRGVRQGEIKALADVNLLVGRNNSGKSTVLEAIMRLAFPNAPHTQDYLGRSILKIWGEFRNETSEFPPVLWYRQDQLRDILLDGQIVEDAEPINSPKRNFALQLKIAPPQSAQPSGSGSEPKISQFLRGVALFRPLDGANREIENQLWPRLLANRRDKNFAQALNEIFGLNAESFQLLPDRRLMVLFPDHSVPLDVQGDGPRAAIRALFVLSLLEGTMFLMEEPESHQHPGSLERFALAVCKQAKEQKVQVVISTHSSECVRSFLNGCKGAGAQGAVFHLNLSDGVLKAKRLDPEAIETLQNSGVDIRFLDLYG